MRPTSGARQRWLLWSGLAATLLAAAWAALTPDVAEPVVVARRADRTAAAATAAIASAPASAPVAFVPRATWPDASPALLAAWGQVPAAAPSARPPVAVIAANAAAPVPPVPVAPPLPYRWIGRVEEDGHQRAMLDGPLRTLLVGENEMLDAQWRVEHIGETHIDLLWLPGGVKQQLAFAS